MGHSDYKVGYNKSMILYKRMVMYMDQQTSNYTTYMDVYIKACMSSESIIKDKCLYVYNKNIG